MAKALLTFPSSLPDTDIKIVDTTGEEFWFDAVSFVLALGLAIRWWTKRQIIDAYKTRPEGRRLPC